MQSGKLCSAGIRRQIQYKLYELCNTDLKIFKKLWNLFHEEEYKRWQAEYKRGTCSPGVILSLISFMPSNTPFLIINYRKCYFLSSSHSNVRKIKGTYVCESTLENTKHNTVMYGTFNKFLNKYSIPDNTETLITMSSIISGSLMEINSHWKKGRGKCRPLDIPWSWFFEYILEIGLF